MQRNTKIFFVLLLFFFILHTFRDIFQILHIHTWLSDTMRTNHPWCRPYCDYAVFPHEIYGIIATSRVLQRNKVGILGMSVIFAFILMWLGFILQIMGINSINNHFEGFANSTLILLPVLV